MRRRMLALLIGVALVALVLPANVFAAEGTVTCTVTAVLISVTVSDGDVAYGALALEAEEDTIGLNDTQTVTNSGNVREDFTIKSSDATRDGGTAWDLVTATPGHNEFKHEFSTDSGSNWTTMPADNGFTGLMSDVDPEDSGPLDLRITMPGTTDDYLEHSITVTVMAVQASECVDNDGDGYGTGAGCLGPDCDDGDADIHPGALEICDGVDNDCDGPVDEGNPGGGGACDTGLQGVCAPGTQTCVSGSLQCVQDIASSPETCNGLDDDCDGPVDEGSLCDDGNQCTVDSCNGVSGCDNSPEASGTPCEDGLFCTTEDQCDGTGICEGGGPTCPGPDGDTDCSESCDEASDSCTAADPDGSPCNGGTCSGGSCVP